jgi:hypothetical protein
MTLKETLLILKSEIPVLPQIKTPLMNMIDKHV